MCEGAVMDDTERQFREADAAVDKAVADFISKIESMSGRSGRRCASVHP